MVRLLYFGLFKNNFLRVRNFSPLFLVYLFSHTILSGLALPYHGYMVFFWTSGPAARYNIDVMYWLGIHTTNYFTITPILVFFLTLERLSERHPGRTLDSIR
ncbi:hypothetical protein Ddc_14758 [Ditylenchus destructor]|nr:hypothetical protein Ddc_14758 [Ditylenchus destructor]